MIAKFIRIDPEPTTDEKKGTPVIPMLERQSTTAPAGIGAQPETKADKIRIAKQKGYEGDMCHRCFNFTLVRSGSCTKCDTCGETSGCG